MYLNKVNTCIGNTFCLSMDCTNQVCQSRGGPRLWSARSSNLLFIYVFLLGDVKRLVYTIPVKM